MTGVLDDRVLRRTLPGVLDFWTVGDTWTDPQVSAFKAGLQPVA